MDMKVDTNYNQRHHHISVHKVDRQNNWFIRRNKNLINLKLMFPKQRLFVAKPTKKEQTQNRPIIFVYKLMMAIAIIPDKMIESSRGSLLWSSPTLNGWNNRIHTQHFDLILQKKQTEPKKLNEWTELRERNAIHPESNKQIVFVVIPSLHLINIMLFFITSVNHFWLPVENPPPLQHTTPHQFRVAVHP